MKKEKLGVDIDETIVWFLKNFLGYYNRKEEEDFEPEDFDSYRWWETLDISKEKAYEEVDEYIEEQRLDMDYGDIFPIEIVEGAEQALDLLSRSYELHAVSNRDPRLHEYNGIISSRQYVWNGDGGTFFPEIPFEDLKEREGKLILPVDRIHLAKDRTKADVCKKLEIEKIVDDDPAVARNCSSEGIETILLERPWNKDTEEGGLIKKAGDWNKACKILTDYNINFEPKPQTYITRPQP